MEQYPSDNFIPQREPNEVTLEYVAEPKPYVAYYVQDRPLPGRKPETAAQEPPAKTRRKGHRGLKIFLICLAAVLVLCSATRFLRNRDRIVEKKSPILRSISEARSLASTAPQQGERPTQEGGLF